MNTNFTSYSNFTKRELGRTFKQRSILNTTSSDQAKNYLLLLELYTLNKSEALAAKAVKLVAYSSRQTPQTVQTSEESVLVKLKYTLNHFFGSLLPRTVTITE